MLRDSSGAFIEDREKRGFRLGQMRNSNKVERGEFRSFLRGEKDIGEGIQKDGRKHEMI